jgi:multicomponent Na+:H+ antiporter subunit B
LKYLHLIMTGLTGLLLALGSLGMPETGDAQSPASLHVSPRYIEQSFEETAVPNMVTSILADYRSFDTLGEGTVIFTAALAVLLILRTGRDEEEERKDS